MATPKKLICSCAACHVNMFEGEDLVQNPVYKCGELSYIELAHRKCIPEWAANDDHVFHGYLEQAEGAPWKYEAQPAPAATFADLWPA